MTGWVVAERRLEGASSTHMGERVTLVDYRTSL